MNNDLLFLFLAIVIIIAFIVIIYYWFKISNDDYVVDDSIKGFYKTAGLNQRCIAGSKQEEYNLLPQYYTPQNCGINQVCVYGDSGSIYGFCKSTEGSYCNSIFDCAPNNISDIYCIGGICTAETGGVLYSTCGYSNTIGTGSCSTNLGLECYKGICYYANGQPCTGSNQCVSGYCLGNTGATSGTCIGQYTPGQQCFVDFCQTGYKCDFSQGDYGYCQFLTKGDTGNVFPIQTGSTGALCSIPNGYTPELPCNSGLICSFDSYTLNPIGLTGLTGLGQCDSPVLQIGANCNEGGACVPPSVCSSYNTTIPYCQAPLDDGGTGAPNINYCGYGSSFECGTGYTCIGIECKPNTGYLCNTPGITGICQSSICSGNKIGIFTPIRSGGTGIGSFGNWIYMDLPSSETNLPSNTSFLSTYQYMSISGSQPIVNTRIIYYPDLSVNNYFWYKEIQVDNISNIIVVKDWTQIDLINNSGNIVNGIKFTTGGNITMSISVFGEYSILLFDFTDVNFISNNLDISLDTLPTTIPTPNIIIDWDFDDTYNVVSSSSSVVVMTTTGTPILPINQFYYGSKSSPLTSYTYTNDNINQMATWVKYIYNYSSNPNTKNFIHNGTVPTENTYSVISAYDDTVIGNLREPTCSGVGAFFNYTNNIESLELFYISNRGFNYYNAVFNNSTSKTYNSEDIQIQSYCPSYDLNTDTTNKSFYNSNFVSTLSYGNLDRRMYALIQICE